jgi:hypothetical protein
MSTIPPPEPRHGIAELLRLVGAMRRLAFDRSLPPSETLGRIRDTFNDYDHQRRVLVRHDVGGALSVRPGRRSVIPS